MELTPPPGKGMTSVNAHCGPVDFLVAASTTLTSDLLRHDLTNMDDHHREEDKGGKKAEPSHREAPPPGSLLLQYRLGSTPQLPGELLSPRPPPQRPPEDGSVYALTGDPGVWVRGPRAERGGEGEARRCRVTSTAVFSGGRGQRRLGGPSEGTGNLLMVWQLPLSTSSH